jgi:hypothetical protein
MVSFGLFVGTDLRSGSLYITCRKNVHITGTSGHGTVLPSGLLARNKTCSLNIFPVIVMIVLWPVKYNLA